VCGRPYFTLMSGKSFIDFLTDDSSYKELVLDQECKWYSELDIRSIITQVFSGDQHIYI
jgi:hypothetical protein